LKIPDNTHCRKGLVRFSNRFKMLTIVSVVLVLALLTNDGEGAPNTIPAFQAKPVDNRGRTLRTISNPCHDWQLEERIRSNSVALLMAKTTKKKTKKGGGSSAVVGLKGFGSVSVSSPSSSKNSVEVEMERSNDARTFYDFLEKSGAGDTLSRCGLGYFPLGEDGTTKLRGVVALKDMKKGDPIIRIPYETAINLGPEGADPTGPALALLRVYCETVGGDKGPSDTTSKKRAYFAMLPPFRGEDCLGSTDFFSDDALNALQTPLVVAETLKRRQRTLARFESEVAVDESFPTWVDGSPVTVEHLQWAVWLITSRVLTVQGGAEEGMSYRLLIPFLDMCNHDRSSIHVLTGRAVAGGDLKVVAGGVVKAGEQINICYGGGMAGNDRFLQDYGFLDTSGGNFAYSMVAQQLLGKRRILEGAGSGRLISEQDREDTLKQLRSTTMEEDTKALEAETDSSLRQAYQYRLGIKKALSKFIVMQESKVGSA
jgi:SET domain